MINIFGGPNQLLMWVSNFRAWLSLIFFKVPKMLEGSQDGTVSRWPCSSENISMSGSFNESGIELNRSCCHNMINIYICDVICHKRSRPPGNPHQLRLGQAQDILSCSFRQAEAKRSSAFCRASNWAFCP